MSRLHSDVLRRLARARERMHHDSASELRVSELAREACLSEQHFTRLFRAIYGSAPQRYLSGLRIAHARQLLALDRSVTEVCLAVGYSSLGTFSQRFALHTAMSPRVYQRQLRGFGAVPDRLRALYVPACFLERFGLVPPTKVRLEEAPVPFPV